MGVKVESAVPGTKPQTLECRVHPSHLLAPTEGGLGHFMGEEAEGTQNPCLAPVHWAEPLGPRNGTTSPPTLGPCTPVESSLSLLLQEQHPLSSPPCGTRFLVLYPCRGLLQGPPRPLHF